MNVTERVINAFQEQFGEAPALVVRAPGRVNLIGEHTDYNDGFVLPMAIERQTVIALRLRADKRLHLYSSHFGESAEISLEEEAHRYPGWAEYINGMAVMLRRAGIETLGWEGVFDGDVPVGSGLSSSAAVEMAAGRAFAALLNLDWDAAAMARLGQQTENHWMDVNSGIMDQMISAAGQANAALLIDCRSLETQTVPLPPGTSVVILDTTTRRGLVDSLYNERRQQCEAAAAYFGVKALRDVSVEMFEARADGLDEVTHRRARHIVTENDRTLEAASVMRAGDAERLGVLMDASHISLRDDFEVSSKELNQMVECARQQPGCYGARMTGAGFGGCAVALVRADAASTFAEAVAACYQAATNLTPAIYVTQAAAGASILQDNR